MADNLFMVRLILAAILFAMAAYLVWPASSEKGPILRPIVVERWMDVKPGQTYVYSVGAHGTGTHSTYTVPPGVTKLRVTVSGPGGGPKK
jgi:hypothetical protein